VARHGGVLPDSPAHMATLVERHSRFTILMKVSSKDTATVVDALTRQVSRLPASLRRSLTWDRGLEMARHKSFSVATKVNVYFCDPQSLAARHQRKHQRTTKTMLPKEDRLIRLLADRLREGRLAPQSTHTKDFGL